VASAVEWRRGALAAGGGGRRVVATGGLPAALLFLVL
jgi:hypothetical protein